MEMTAENEARIYEALEDRFGCSGQIIVAIEEMAELQKALTKWLRYTQLLSEGNLNDIRASIMLNQLELMFGDTADIQERKLQRAYDIVADLFDEDGNIKRFRFLDGEDEE